MRFSASRSAGLLLISAQILTVACQGVAGHSRDVIPSHTPAALAATMTPPPTPTAIRTPPALPGVYGSSYLNPLDAIHTYVGDTCTYLRNKWDSGKAAPGTVVMVVMLGSVNRRRGEGPEAMTAALLARMMEELHEQRFHAINMQQLAGFLERNERIPYRSVVLIQDGRRYPENFSTHFRRYWDQWGWPVVNAWNHQGTTADGLWEQYLAFESEGWVDFQTYGPAFSPTGQPPTDEYLTKQLQGSVTQLQERLHKVPTGVVWPNGFSAPAARIARRLGYRLGFTFNPRGPIMYNWVPLSVSPDKFRPSFLPESSVDDPLMTLPRYWGYQVHDVIDAVRITGKEAAAYAEHNRSVELEYYDIVCASSHGPIPE